jgi:hypothetical protein
MTTRVTIWLAVLLMLAGAIFAGWHMIGPQQPAGQSDTPEAGQGELLPEIAREIITPPPLRGPLADRGITLTVSGIFSETNKQRSAASSKPLLHNTTLNQAAQNKLNDMFAKGYFDHISPSGQGPAEVVEGVGYEYIRVGENLALGNFASDAALVQAWMDSPGHRANILSRGFTAIGIAVGQGHIEGRQTWLAVQTFGTPVTACDQPSQVFKQSITVDQHTLAVLQQQLQDRDSVIEKQLLTIQGLADEIGSLTQQGNTNIQHGNQQIEQGNQIYQQTGSQEQAQPYWERGQQLQREGQQLLNEAQQKQTGLAGEQSKLTELQRQYNATVDEYNSLNDKTAADVTQYNTQVKAFNACVERFNNQ